MARAKDDLPEIKRLLQRIARQQDLILRRETTLQREEREVEHEERAVLTQERAQVKELQELERIEQDIKEEVKGSPLGRITMRDFNKSLIGAFFGTVGHFAFFYGTKLAHDITMVRATVLYVVSFLLAAIFMYYAGFRKVDRSSLLALPLRVGVIYCTSIAVILFVLAVFGFITSESAFADVYRTVSTISILAVLGAAAADLIGREE